MIIQLENSVSDDDCARLTAIYDRHIDLTNLRDHTGHPVVYWNQLRTAPDAAETVPRLVKQSLCVIIDQLSPSCPIYPETVILAALGAGGYHSRHADNSRQTEQGDWVANHTPQRDVTAIYYLNDEFEGGEIVFDLQELAVRPRRGLLLAFPSDAPHVHEVLPVRTGFRYTMAIWFTRQQRYAIADLSFDGDARLTDSICD
jgi:predicted 2-oxoglutarate/Fe(II)-dependent dioxygenase YbiX